MAHHRHARREGRLAYLGFTGVWYGQLLRRRVQRDQGLRDHRPAGLSARADGEVQVLGQPRQVRPGRQVASSPGRQFTVEINNPKGEKVFEKTYTADEYGGFDGEFDAAGRRHARASTG